MSKNVLMYGRFHTTSYIFIHVLQRLLSRFRDRVEGIDFYLVLDDRRDLEIARCTLPSDRVTISAEYEDLQPFRRDAPWPDETIRRWEWMYGSPHLRCYFENERALQGRPEEVRWRYLFSHIEYFEHLAQRTRPILYVSGAADGLNPWLAMKVFSANGTPCLSFSPCRFEHRSFVLDNPYEVLGISDLYKEKLLVGLSPADVEAAQSIMKRYRAGEVKPADHLAVQSRKRRIIPRLTSTLSLIREAYTDSGNFDLPLREALKRALRGRRTALRNLLLRRRVLFGLPAEERFFFFPLQFEPEISLGTQGRGWTNQLDLIRLVNDCLPIDRWLYVKEHPSMLSGIRPLGFYRQILSLPRVRLLDQRMNSYDIIPRAEAVLTITGTAGWEALMLQRPVVLFGHSFYEEFEEGVIRLDRVEDLPGILRSLRHREIPEEALLAYVASVLTRAPEGIFIEPRVYPTVADLVLGERNLDNIATVILNRLAEVTEASGR